MRAEECSRGAFQILQDNIYSSYGIQSPKKPLLRVRNATQTSIVLEWDPIDLAAADLRSLTLYRNNSKAGAIPNPTSHTSTKISGLGVDTEYSFYLILRTSAGSYSSEKVTSKTHKMTDLSGITVCPGVMSTEVRERLESVLDRIGANPLQDAVRIDTTHFVCTEGRGAGWERAQDMNIPIVRPEWVEACEKEHRIVGVRQFYLGSDISKMRQGLQPRAQTPTQTSHRSPSPRQLEATPTTIDEGTKSEAELDHVRMDKISPSTPKMETEINQAEQIIELEGTTSGSHFDTTLTLENERQNELSASELADKRIVTSSPPTPSQTSNKEEHVQGDNFVSVQL